MSMYHERAGGRARRAIWLAGFVPLWLVPPVAPLPDPPVDPRSVAVVCEAAPASARVRAPDPFSISLAPTANANGAAGSARLTFAMSPFGVTVTEQGHHRYRLHMRTSGLESAPGTALVAWAVSPALDQVHKLGTLDARGELIGEVALNKFLVFVTAEPSANVAKWSGPILLRGISRSGRMHTMLGHGPFEGEAC